MSGAKITKFNKFQTAFIPWAMSKKSMLLQAQPGAGKTLAVMGFYLYLKQKLGAGKLLVVTARKNADAFKKANVKNLLLLNLFSKKDMAVMYGGYDFPADIYIISNTLLTTVINNGTTDQKRALTELLRKTTVLCVDEIHGFRSYDSARTRAMKKVTDYYHTLIRKDPNGHRFVGVTATPIFKTLEDVHPLFSLLCSPNILGSWKSFVDRYCEVEVMSTYGSRKVYTSNGSHSYRDSNSFDRIVGYKNVDELHKKIDPYIFVWEDTNFNFDFNLKYYDLSIEERNAYLEAIRGLGLDKTYAIDLDVGGKRVWVYRDKSDTFILSYNKQEIRTDDLMIGTQLLFDGFVGVVQGVFAKKVDANYATRAVKAQQCNSGATQKLSLIADIIRSQDSGALVYFNFLESVETFRRYLMQQFPTRRIVVLTGDTKDFNQVVASIGKNDIVLMSSVASQSIDIYIKRLIVAECFGLTPGKVEQLVGRMARENADYRDVEVTFVLRIGENVESYFYEKLRHRLRTSKSNVFVSANSLPASESVSKIPEHLIDDHWLKKKLLWSLG